MRATIIAGLLQAVAFTATDAYPITGNDVKCRTGPGTNYSIKKTYAKGTDVQITCQTEGMDIFGNSIWDKTTDGCYVSDYYIRTGVNDYVTKKCSPAGPYPITADDVKCRSGPGTSYSIKKTYAKGTDVQITCQTEGTNIFGNSIWDKTTDGCYVSDYYIRTGVNDYVTGRCGSSGGDGGDGGGGGGDIPGPVRDDYPYKSSCGGVDPWRYYKCQCTSFVAWRINERLGVDFHNQYRGVNWGNAGTWAAAARRTGVRVDSTPVPGSIAHTDAGQFGHVAWVAAVDGDRVTVEEYNYAAPERYGTRTVSKSAFNYIHIKV